jgi:hypothetical protein
MASDFIANEKPPSLLLAAEQGGVVILPVVTSPSNFKSADHLSLFQAVNPPCEPLLGMNKVKHEAVFELLARSIQQRVRVRNATDPTPLGKSKTRLPMIHVLQ